jgi:hypothetical protein
MLRTLGSSGKFFWGRRSGTFSLLTIAAIICLLSGCSRAQQLPANAQPLTGEKNVLIVYLSRTNNTKAIAEFIHQKVGGTIVPLELETPYPANYNATVQQVAWENETGIGDVSFFMTLFVPLMSHKNVQMGQETASSAKHAMAKTLGKMLKH